VADVLAPHGVERSYDEAEVGVGWDYYLDRLIAARAGRPMPDWNDYHPAMIEHYQNLCRELDKDIRVEHATLHAVGQEGNGTVG
jgi:hypothetical protein